MIKDLTLARSISSWPFKEAVKVLDRIEWKVPKKGYVLFETGYGPSGLPHIGTFGEVVRVIMVIHAFKLLSDIPMRLWCVSDDMDGMRKIPDTIPNPKDYVQYIGLPLTAVPDPFNTHESFGHNMNARLRNFLNHFGLEYEFISATECYKAGLFNEYLIKVLENYQAIMDIMLPTLGDERKETYSPFLPLCPKTGVVLQVPIKSYSLERRTVTYSDGEDQDIEVNILNGCCKLQWKPDFGMRWAAFDVDFEMYGKDHLVNGQIYSRICSVLGGRPPEQMFYELFLDESGQKISKSKGNGLSIDQWLRYGTEDSLKLFMYQSPQKAKKLHYDIIPKIMDEYLAHLGKYHKIDTSDHKALLENPIAFIHKDGVVPKLEIEGVSYALLINLVNACSTHDEAVIWGYLQRMDMNASPQTMPLIDSMIKRAMNYYEDFVKPLRVLYKPNEEESSAISVLLESLMQLVQKSDSMISQELADLVQTAAYSIAKDRNMDLRQWFKTLYMFLLGADSGPRFGSFVALYGLQGTIDMIKQRLA